MVGQFLKGMSSAVSGLCLKLRLARRWTLGLALGLTFGLTFSLATGPGVNEARGIEPDQIGAALGLTKATKSLPVWSQPSGAELEQLTRQIKTCQSGVFLVGNAQGHGTAFVISKRHRLLVTNAHVADILFHHGSMLAIANGTASVTSAKHVWYHPGVRRTRSGDVVVRSQKPQDGEVYARSPDLAVLELDAGPELPHEFPLATWDEVRDCFAQPVGMLGFPGHDTEGWPGVGERALATLREGVVCRVSDFQGRVDGTEDKQQFVQHSMTSWFGFSGSPIFLPNGRVVAVNNSCRTEKKGEHQVQIAFGVRADAIWELLAFHGLDEKVPLGVSRDRLSLDRFERVDPAEERQRQAERLVKQAAENSARGELDLALRQCSEAIELSPAYAAAYSQRAVVNSVLRLKRFPRLRAYGEAASNEQIRLSQMIHDDEQKNLELHPTDPQAMLHYLQQWMSLDFDRGNYVSEEKAAIFAAAATKLIDQPELSRMVRADAYNVRSTVKSSTRSFNRQVNFSRQVFGECLRDMNEAVRLVPWDPTKLHSRSVLCTHLLPAQAAADRRRVSALMEADKLSSEAWAWATSADENRRDGARALNAALQACQTTDFECPHHLEALAAAYAEQGDFVKAEEFESKALRLSEEKDRAELRARLKLYRQGRPYRDE